MAGMGGMDDHSSSTIGFGIDVEKDKVRVVELHTVSGFGDPVERTFYKRTLSDIPDRGILQILESFRLGKDKFLRKIHPVLDKLFTELELRQSMRPDESTTKR
jgi:hypothetical protein